MPNDTEAIEELLSTLDTLAVAIYEEDDIWDFDDEMEVLIPRIARRIIRITDEGTDGDRLQGLTYYIHAIAHFVRNPENLPPLEPHDEEG